MPGRFGHYGHLLRVAALFAIGLGGFLVARHMLVPSDFGSGAKVAADTSLKSAGVPLFLRFFSGARLGVFAIVA